MQKIFALITACGCLALVSCSGGGADYDGSDLMTSTTECHKKYHKRAYNKPYEIKGTTYHPQKHYEYKAVGLASFYGGGDVFHGRKTSNGEVFDMNLLSAAHKTIPIPAVVLVTNLQNGRALKLKVNDRGPFKDGRIIDVSRKAARMLGFEQKGLAKVRVETLVPESLVLAESMANGTPRSSPFYNQQIMLVDEKSRNSNVQNRGVVHVMQLAQGIKTGGQKSSNSINNDFDQSQMHLHPSIYSHEKLPNIYLAQKIPVKSSLKTSTQILNKLPKALPRPQNLQRTYVRPPVQNGIQSTQNHPNGPHYFIQTGIFNQFDSAQQLITLFNKNSPKIHAKMQPVKMNNRRMFRVLVGPFANKTQAYTYAHKLKSFDKRSSVIIN